MQVKHLPENYVLINLSQDIEAMAYDLNNMDLLAYGCLFVRYDLNDEIKAIWGCESNIPYLSNSLEKII
jgi:hypothetical protein